MMDNESWPKYSNDAKIKINDISFDVAVPATYVGGPLYYGEGSHCGVAALYGILSFVPTRRFSKGAPAVFVEK